jgi:hypothetical protein
MKSKGVEPEGIEPSSKQVTDKVSTCLSCYWLSGINRKQAPNLYRSPFIFAVAPGLATTSPA